MGHAQTVDGHAQLLSTTQEVSALEVLSKHAYGAETSPIIVANVLRGTSMSMSMSKSMSTSGHTLMFPECGSGYHEWAVVQALRARGHRVRTVVLMDAYVPSNEECITQAWQQLAQQHCVELVVLGSYVALEQWVMQQQPPSEPTLVLYINGMLSFSRHWCGREDPDACCEAAMRFWGWCDSFAANRVPHNYIRESVWCLTGSKTWSGVARAFDTPAPAAHP
jgi:hypothetical protein